MTHGRGYLMELSMRRSKALDLAIENRADLRLARIFLDEAMRLQAEIKHELGLPVGGQRAA